MVRAIEQVYANSRKKEFVTDPLVGLSGKPGPQFPVDENPRTT